MLIPADSSSRHLVEAHVFPEFRRPSSTDVFVTRRYASCPCAAHTEMSLGNCRTLTVTALYLAWDSVLVAGLRFQEA